MQTVRAIINEEYQEHYLPDAENETMPGIKWGKFDEMFTPAYWASQVWMRRYGLQASSHRLGNTLQEEIAACLLGGYGIPAEVGLAAFETLREQGLLARTGVTEWDILEVLSAPLNVGNRSVRYRFAQQKSHYLSAALAKTLESTPSTTSDVAFRDWLVELPGIGLKTASWITRNWLDSDNVAILDIHLYRAGVLAGFFRRSDRVDKNYRSMETAFLNFARAIDIRPSILDTVIWFDMKTAGATVHSLLKECA